MKHILFLWAIVALCHCELIQNEKIIKHGHREVRQILNPKKQAQMKNVFMGAGAAAFGLGGK